MNRVTVFRGISVHRGDPDIEGSCMACSGSENTPKKIYVVDISSTRIRVCDKQRKELIDKLGGNK